jgi:hypothetical protein
MQDVANLWIDINPTLSDRELFAAVAACCQEDDGRLVYTEEVRALFAKYGGTISSIPQEHRAGFLAELSAVSGRPLPKMGVPPPLDYVTVAEARVPVTKVYHRVPDGSVVKADASVAKHFTFERLMVWCLEDIREIVHLMTVYHCIILGKTRDGVSGHARRLLKPDKKTGDAATLEDRPQRFLWVDYDGANILAEDAGGLFVPTEDTARAGVFVRDQLSPPFRDARALVLQTGSAGMGRNPLAVHVRLVFELSRPLTCAQQKAWLQSLSVGLPFDLSIYSPERELFGFPAFEGVADPVRDRSWIIDGVRVVEVPDNIKVAPKRKAQALTPGQMTVRVASARHPWNQSAARQAFDRKIKQYEHGISAGDRHRGMFDIAQAPFAYTDDIDLVRQWVREDAFKLLEPGKYDLEHFYAEVDNAYQNRINNGTLCSRATVVAEHLITWRPWSPFQGGK